MLAGGVHDMVVLFCSVRHRGKSLAYIASQEIDTTTGRVAAWAVLAILLLTLAGLSIAVVNAMHNSLWSTYTVFCTIPIAVLMGLYMQVWRKGRRARRDHHGRRCSSSASFRARGLPRTPSTSDGSTSISLR